MYKTYWGMQFNPFSKDVKVTDAYSSADQREATKRGEFLKNVRGIGLFTGSSGVGKTFSQRAFIDSLNPSLYRAVYIPLTTVPSGDFYRALARGLGLESAYRKIDNFKRIQDRIRDMAREQRITPVIVIDEAQYLNKAVLTDLKILMNFDMDSKDYAIMILSGQPELNATLGMQVHESLAQRIVVNYNFQGLSEEETAEYVRSRMTLCGVTTDVFAPAALIAAFASSTGSIRKLNSIVHKSLMIGCEEKLKMIDAETIRKAVDEVELV